MARPFLLIWLQRGGPLLQYGTGTLGGIQRGT
jgi:hypothetical protein